MTLTGVQRISLEQATAQYESTLTDGNGYLDRRGIPPHVARTYRLGYVKEPLIGHDHLAGRLSIPYLTRTGVVDLKFRCTAEHDCKAEKCTKYLGYGGISTRIFNPEAIIGNVGDYIGIAEGELDAIILTAMCGIPSVGVPGVSQWKQRYERFGWEDFRRVFIFADADDSGEGHRFASQVAHAISNAVVIDLPPGEDVNSYYLKAGAEGILTLVGLMRGYEAAWLGEDGRTNRTTEHSGTESVYEYSPEASWSFSAGRSG